MTDSIESIEDNHIAVLVRKDGKLYGQQMPISSDDQELNDLWQSAKFFINNNSLL